MTILRTLAKADRLLEKLKAAQPVDPLALLSTEQREYYERWWARFKARHSKTPDALYEATISRRGWTPSEWMNYPRITTDMTVLDVQHIYFEQLGRIQ